MLVVYEISQTSNFNDSPMIIASVIACIAMLSLILFKKEAKHL